MHIVSRRLLRSAIVGVITLFASPIVASAQVGVSWDELRRQLAPGDSVEVVHASGEKLRGKVVAISKAAIELAVRDRRETMAVDAVASVARGRDSAVQGLLIGAAIGGGLVGALALSDLNEADEYWPFALAYAGLGGLIGGIADFLFTKPQIKYVAAGRTVMFDVRAHVSSHRKGASLVVRF